MNASSLSALSSLWDGCNYPTCAGPVEVIALVWGIDKYVVVECGQQTTLLSDIGFRWKCPPFVAFHINNGVYLQLKLKQPFGKSRGSLVKLTFNQQPVGKNADMQSWNIYKLLVEIWYIHHPNFENKWGLLAHTWANVRAHTGLRD